MGWGGDERLLGHRLPKLDLVERFREMLATFRVAGLPVCRFYKSPQGSKVIVKWTRLVLIVFLVRIENPDGTCEIGKPANRQPEKRPTFPGIALAFPSKKNVNAWPGLDMIQGVQGRVWVYTLIVTPALENCFILTSALEKSLIVTPALEKSMIVIPALDESMIVTPALNKCLILTPALNQSFIATPALEKILLHCDTSSPKLTDSYHRPRFST